MHLLRLVSPLGWYDPLQPIEVDSLLVREATSVSLVGSLWIGSWAPLLEVARMVAVVVFLQVMLLCWQV